MMTSSLELLAIIGAVTGVAGVSVAMIAFVLDRPRLTVITSSSMKLTATGRTHVHRIYVVNAGRRPIPIVKVGLQSRRPPPTGLGVVATWGQRIALGPDDSWRRSKRPEEYFALSLQDDPVVLQPGEIRKFLMGSTDGQD